MTTQQQQSAGKPIDDIRKSLGSMAAQFQAVMPTKEHVDRFIRITVTAVQQNPKLMEADRNSFYAACMKCAQDGLLPDGKEAVLNIYKENIGTRESPDWKAVVQYQPMIEGMLKKLRNSDDIIGAPSVQVVKEFDKFEFRLGDDESIVHHPHLDGDRGKTRGAYSIVKFKDGGVSREYMSIDEIMQVRARSKAKDSGPWKLGEGGKHTTEFDEMARKTVFRRHTKKLPKSTDLDNLIDSDNDTFDRYPQPAVASNALAAPSTGDTGTASTGAERPKALQNVVDQGGGEKVIDGTVTGKTETKVAAGSPPADVL